jgi:hypothetical protein
VVAVVPAILDAWLVFWTPTGDSYKSPLAVPMVTFFLLIVLFAVVSQRMSRKLLQEMKSSGPRSVSTESIPNAVVSPAPPLIVDIFTSENLPPPLPRGEELAQRSRRMFCDSVAVHRKMAWYLGAANLTVGLVGFAVGVAWASLALFMLILAVATPLLHVVANPKTVDILPAINIPVVTVIWNYAGLSPTEM